MISCLYINQLLNSNPVFITIADHTLSIDIDFGALISLLNWKANSKP